MADAQHSLERFNIESVGGEHPHHAVILVGGIHDTYHYWDNWKGSAGGADTVVLGFKHDHSTETMPQGAHQLADGIRALHEAGIEDVTVIAHSMGGLVAKGGLDEIARSGDASHFHHIELQTFGTPFGGFAVADHMLPGASTISSAIGYPMAPDIGPHSDYMQSLAQKWPENMDFRMTVGTADHVALPGASSTEHLYNAIEQNATSVTLVEGFKHTDYHDASPLLLNASNHQQQVPGFESFDVQQDATNSHGQPLTTLEIANEVHQNPSHDMAQENARHEQSRDVEAHTHTQERAQSEAHADAGMSMEM